MRRSGSKVGDKVRRRNAITQFPNCLRAYKYCNKLESYRESKKIHFLNYLIIQKKPMAPHQMPYTINTGDAFSHSVISQSQTSS